MERERARLPVFAQYDCQSCFFMHFYFISVLFRAVTREWEEEEEEAVFHVNHGSDNKDGNVSALTFSEFRVDEKQGRLLSTDVS